MCLPFVPRAPDCGARGFLFDNRDRQADYAFGGSAAATIAKIARRIDSGRVGQTSIK